MTVQLSGGIIRGNGGRSLFKIVPTFSYSYWKLIPIFDDPRRKGGTYPPETAEILP